ncbi:MAG: FprA family A-type flavoprotein [Bacilli bacterium]|nr:FprA family A-type flavoprotein [Bacilli bacterium]
MHCEFPLDEGFYYVGGSDRRLALFENVYPLENGVSYNSFLFLDDKTVLLDTVDQSISKVFFENVEHLLSGRALDYLIIDHMEPDHASTIADLVLRHPETTLIMSAMASTMLKNFFPRLQANIQTVTDGDSIFTGKRTFHFMTAQMVHWPEVIFTYEESTATLFSADAFGTFGALSGNIIEDGSSFEKEHLSEARRYYANIVGKYGVNVSNALVKASAFPFKRIAPLHGPIYEGNLSAILAYYGKWANYEPEDKEGVLIAYASIYGGTENAAEIYANRLAKLGVKNIKMYDVSKTDSSYLVGESFRVRHIALFSSSYNAGVFQKMEDYLTDLSHHLVKNRVFAVVENGSWAPSASRSIHAIIDSLPGVSFLPTTFTIKSTLKEDQLDLIEKLAAETLASLKA